MNSGSSRFDLKRVHRVIVGNLAYLRVTGGTLGWALLYTFLLFFWWKHDGRPELALLLALFVAGMFFLWLTLEYPLTWIRTRRKEFRQVMKAYYDYMDSLPPDYRVGQPAKALWDALVQLRNGLDEPDRQLEPERQPNGQAES